MIIRIVLSLILGLLSSLLVLERDPVVKQALGDYCIAMFESAMNCHMKCTIARIDLLRRTIELEDVDVSPREQDLDAWHWTCKNYHIKISPWAFLTRRVISMSMSLEDIEARSKLENNSLAIMPHLQMLAKISAAAALELKTLSLRRVRIAADDAIQGHHIDIGFNSDSKVLANAFKIVFNWTHGSVSFAGRLLFNDLQGSIDCDFLSACSDPEDSVIVHIDCSCILPQLQGAAKRCFIGGTYEHGAITAHLKSANDLLVAGPLKVKWTNDGIVAGGVLSVPVSYLWALAYNSDKGPGLDGSCMARVQAVYNDKGLQFKGSCGIKDLFWGKSKIASLVATTFSHTKNMWQGHLQYKRDEIAIDGTWHWDQDAHNGAAELDNSSRLHLDMLPNLSIDPHMATIKTTFDDQYKLKGTYKAIISHNKTDIQDTVAGSIEADKQCMSINGLYNNYSYALACSYNPDIRLQKLLLKNEKNESLIEIHGRGKACQGSVELSSVRPIIKNFTNIDIQGQGTFKLYGMIEHESLIIKTKLDAGTIRIPKTYMCVTGFDSSASIDFTRKALTIDYARVKLYEGSVVCRRATALFDDSLHLSYAQVPLLINDCLFNVRKDLFGVLSGNILVTKKLDTLPHVQGIVLIDKAQLTETLFSGVLHDVASQSTQGLKAANSFDSTCDFQVLTYNPIRVDTPFLDGQARMNMQIQGHIADPSISGSVAFQSGKLIFPYRPLNITKANITLSPGAMTDPLIEIVAKNRVKKYMISLQVVGSLQNHQIVLSSTPTLSHEQILGLLLIGSEEESLGSMVPALVMQNIKPLIFGSEWTNSLEKYFNVLLKPLQYVHFVPSFGNQAGRGGLRGTLEIDLNDRWRAMIQNNFNLSEDTRFEVEYMLSDDISLKGARDEHRDITGEVEMRWKFR